MAAFDVTTNLEQLVLSIFKAGRAPTAEENQYLAQLPYDTATAAVCFQLIQPDKDVAVQQFAASLLKQTIEAASPTYFTNEIAAEAGALIQRSCKSSPSEKIRRDLLRAYGLIIRAVGAWQELFCQFATSTQPDIFQATLPGQPALETFFCLVPSKKYRGDMRPVEFAIDYFINLLERNLTNFSSDQERLLKFVEDWIREITDYGMPAANIGHLMVLTAKFIDCEERNAAQWGEVQRQAANTLDGFFGIPDLYVLQNNMNVLIKVILDFPIMKRLQQFVTDTDRIDYLEVLARILMGFSLEFADMIVVCAKSPENEALIEGVLARLNLLADPFPEKPFSPLEEEFSRDAVTAFSEIVSMMYQMGVSGAAVTPNVLKEIKRFVQILCKRAVRPTATTQKAWSHSDFETYSDMRKDIEKAVSNVVATVGGATYDWIVELFDAVLESSEPSREGILEALCFVTRFACPLPSDSSSMIKDSQTRSILEKIYVCFLTSNADLVAQAFRTLEDWILMCPEEDCQNVINGFVPICIGGLKEGNEQVVNNCGFALMSVISAGRRYVAEFYGILTAAISETLAQRMGSLGTREKLLCALGQLIISLPEADAARELESLLSNISKLFTDVKNADDFLRVMALFPEFFRIIGSTGATENAWVSPEFSTAVARLGTNVLNEMVAFASAPQTVMPTKELEGMETALIKEILFAIGVEVGTLVPQVTEFAVQSFSNTKSPRMLDLIRELSTKYLDAFAHKTQLEQIFKKICQSAIDQKENVDWEDYREFYVQFISAFYPMLRSHTNMVMSTPIDWSGLLQLVAKLMKIPVSGDESLDIPVNVLFEEMLRMKSRNPDDGNIQLTNPVVELLRTNFSIMFVDLFMEKCCILSSDERTARMCSDCLFAMLMELRQETILLMQAWVQRESINMISQQSSALGKLVSSLVAARTKPGFWRVFSAHRQRHR